VCHRGEVGELSLGGAADADAEEALVELELDEAVCALDVGEGDGGRGGYVPDVLAVLLQEVGVALGEGDDAVSGCAFELRAQVPYVQAARWGCGCPSFNLRVDRERAPRSSTTASPAVEAMTKERDEVNGTFDLLLWVDDGWLAGVEIVDYVDRHGEESPDEIPPPEAWSAPQARDRAT
jgi:hypothetical protein